MRLLLRKIRLSIVIGRGRVGSGTMESWRVRSEVTPWSNAFMCYTSGTWYSPTAHEVNVRLRPVRGFLGSFPFVGAAHSDRNGFRSRVHLRVHACYPWGSHQQGRSARGSLTDAKRFLPLEPQSLSDNCRPSGHNGGSIDHCALRSEEILIENLLKVEVAALCALDLVWRSIWKLIIRNAPFPFLG